VNLLRLRDELARKGFVSPDALRIEAIDVTDLVGLVGHSGLGFLRREGWERWIAETGRRPAFELGEGRFRVTAVRLEGLASTLSWPTQPGHTFAHELAGRIRVIAGLDQPPILLHSEDWPSASGPGELRALRDHARCGDDDGLVIVWGPERDVNTAAEEIRLRYVDALDGVPNETRQPLPDGSTDFERILPGPDRMYPDTDSPPSRVTRERVDRLRATLPARPWERDRRYAAAGVPQGTRHYLVRRGAAAIVDRVVLECGADLRFACFFFGERLRGLRRRGVPVERIGDDRWCEFFRAIGARPVLRQAWERIVRLIAESPDASVGALLERQGLGLAPAEWRASVAETCAHLGPAARTPRRRVDPARPTRRALREVMPALRGRVPARDVVTAVEEAMR